MAVLERLLQLEGWRRLLAVFSLGVMAAAALPPLYWLPTIVPAFSLFALFLQGSQGSRQALLTGWTFGVGYFFAGLYWVGIAMTVDLARFWWFIPISVFGLALGLALFTASAAWLAWRVGKGLPSLLFALSGAWVLAEILRGLLLTGFPWNPIASVWAFSALPLQVVSFGGVWVLSGLTVLMAAAPSVLLQKGVPTAIRAWATLLPLGLLILLGLGGLRLQAAPTAGEDLVPGVALRLVQPSVSQAEKWEQALRPRHVRQLIELSQSDGFDRVTHVIWPETAVPYLVNEYEDLRRAIGQAAPPNGLLLTGSPLRDRGEEGEATRYSNSLVALSPEGEIVARYDKTHLVPFGEYVPFRQVLGMVKVTAGASDFSPGPGLVSLDAGRGLPSFSPLICYEVIFPGAVVAKDQARPGWLLNITNDGWFGRSSGPYQHFAQARLRAVEEGLPLVRAANNGISAVIDPYGRILHQLDQDEVAWIDSGLPEPLPPTLFARLGLWAGVSVSMLLLAVALILARRT